MILYFADRRFNILDQASTSLPDGLVVVDDNKIEEVETGIATFECVLPFDSKTRERVKACAKVGNFILRSHNDENEYYTITQTEWNEKNREVYIYAEDAGLDLLNEIVGTYAATEAKPISHYIEQFAYDSGFVIGTNDIATLTRKLSWDGTDTVTSRLASVATQFDNAEISYSFEVKGLKVVKKLINIHKKRGQDAGVQLRFNKEIDNIVITESIDNVATALRVTGGIPEDKETPITLDGVLYDDGDIFLEGTYLKSRKAHAVWSRYLAENGTYTGHICKRFEYDTTSQTELLNRAIAELKKIREIEVNYEIDITSLPENVKVGDRVNVVNDEDELYVSARILKLETSVANETQKATIGEYLIKSSGISKKVEELANQFAIEAVEIKKAHQEALEAQKKAEEAKQSADNAQSAVENVEKDVESLDNKVTASQEAINLANQAAQEAKVNASEAITQATLSLNASSEAKTQAASAQTKAEQAISDATGASDIAQAAKLDAAQAMEDLAEFEGNLNTLESTMKADYARKTELTEVQFSMQSQITQNASQIATTVSRMDTIDETVNSANTKAESAQKAASDAQALAGQAKTNASTAQSKADEANAKAQQAASDLATAEQNLANVTNRVGATEEEIAQAQSDVVKAKEAADDAQAEADAAQKAAGEAKKAADDAQDAADKAQADVDALAVRVTTAETSITQNAEQIALRATKTEVTETLGGYYTKEEADAAIKVKADSITSSVSSTYATKSELNNKVSDYTIEIYNGTGGNPKPVRFASVNYSTCNSENGVAVKIGMVSGHGNGTSYAFLQDVIIRVNFVGEVEIDNTKQYGAETPSYDNEVRQYGDVFAVVDTTNKIVDFYCLMGQYSRVNMTPWKRLTYSSGGSVTQYTSCTVYSSGTKTWANNSDIALQTSVDDLATRVANAETNITQNADQIALRATKSEVTNTLGGYYTKTQTDSAINAKADSITSSVSKTYATQSALSATDTKAANAATAAGEAKTTANQAKSAANTNASNITSLSTRVSQTESRITSQAKSISEHGTKISTLEQTADGFSVSLQTLEGNVSTAQSTANTAKTNASTAQSTANEAKTAASNANTAASNAQSTANTAKTNAANAQSTADTAKTNAATAQSTANEAKTDAANAAKTATDFLLYDSTGLNVGKRSGNAWTGYRTQMASDSFNILDASGNPLATYGANEINLGLNREDTAIKMCDGRLAIKLDADRYYSQISGEILQMISKATISDSEGDRCESVGAVDMFPAGVRGQRKARLYCFNDYGDGSSKTVGSNIDVDPEYIMLETCHGSFDKYARTTFFLGHIEIEAEDYVQVTAPFLTLSGSLNASDGISIDGKDIVDFVVEQGTSGNWKYKKWNSGTCELWCSVSVSNLACATALGAMYRTAEIATPAFPFTVLEPNVVSSYESPGYGALLWPTGTNTTTADPSNYYLVRPTSATIVSGTINMHVKGRWK